MRRRHGIFLVLLFTASVLSPSGLLAAPGDLDPTFGVGGKVVTNFSSMADHTRRIRLSTDGGIYTLTTDAVDGIGVPRWATLRRFTSNGQIDPTFGHAGTVRHAGLRDFDIRPDGRLVLVLTEYMLPHTRTRVVGLTANGQQIDPSFEQTVVTGFGLAEGRRVRIQSNGKVLVSGASAWRSTFLARIGSGGGMDAAFGTNGVTFGHGEDFAYTLIGSWTLDLNGDLVVQPDGKIVYATGGNGYSISRHNADGTHDSSFGVNGTVNIQIPMYGYSYDIFALGLQVMPNGKLLATGSALDWSEGPSRASVVVLDQDGSIDPQFGNPLIDSVSRGPASAILALPDGKVLLGGMTGADFSLTMLRDNGEVDPSFGNGGLITTVMDHGTSAASSILQMALQPDGRVVAAGITFGGLGLARYDLRSPENASISGRVLTPDGRPLRNAVVSLTDEHGQRRSVTTGSFGMFEFDGVPANTAYTIAVVSKRYRYAPMPLYPTDNIGGIELMGSE